MGQNDYEQVGLFESLAQNVSHYIAPKLSVVKAVYKDTSDMDWEELFDGYDELYAITFSSGIRFVNSIVDKFKYSEIVFGYEGIVAGDFATIMAAQLETVKELVKTKAAEHLAEKMNDGKLNLYVSRDIKSHEKLYILKANDGRVRVITGSANMSSSAFCGIQRENIVCFDDSGAYSHYMGVFNDFKEVCADNVTNEVIVNTVRDSEYLNDNIDRVPVMATIKDRVIVLENDENSDEEVFLANVKGHEKELKPMIPKQKSEKKLVLNQELHRGIKRKYRDVREEHKIKEKKLPKLNINYDAKVITFDGKEMNLEPEKNAIASDVNCVLEYIKSIDKFHGNTVQCQMDFYRFFNWFFASPFLPYLRNIANKNKYDVFPFPVYGIMYGASNGGKTTLTKLMSKLMCGKKIPFNSSNDFTSTGIEDLKRACEGLPIIIDDLAKNQYNNHYEKVIKDDFWGIPEGFINYPSVVITTNKLPSLPHDITKRAVVCYIDANIDKETGAKNSRRINEFLDKAGTALFAEYARRMMDEVIEMGNKMINSEIDYFPDIFDVSSTILLDIISSSVDEVPSFARHLSYSDYYGDEVIGRNAIGLLKTAWKYEKKQFKIDKKNNKVTYSYPEHSSAYELNYLIQELPPALDAKKVGSSLVMNYDAARQILGISKKGIF